MIYIGDSIETEKVITCPGLDLDAMYKELRLLSPVEKRATKSKKSTRQ